MSCGAAASLPQLPSLAPSPPMFPRFLTPEINHKPSLRNACSHALAQPEGPPHAAAELAEQQEAAGSPLPWTMRPRQITEPARPEGRGDSKSAGPGRVRSTFPRGRCSSLALQNGSKLKIGQRSPVGVAGKPSPVLGMCCSLLASTALLEGSFDPEVTK